MTDTITVSDLGPLELTARSTGGKYPPQFIIDVSTPEGQRVGYFRFIVTGLPRSSDSRLLRWMDRRSREEPKIIAGNINVDSRYQRKGVARAVYQWVKNLGNDIVPSSTQTAAGRAMWQGFQREPLSERQTPTIRGQILDTVQRDGGKISEYFVRFTDIDKMGFSDRQRFKRHLDVDEIGRAHV